MIELNPTLSTLLIIGVTLLVIFLIMGWLASRLLASRSLSTQLLVAMTGLVVLSLVSVIGAFIFFTRIILTEQTKNAFATLTEANSQRIKNALIREVELLENLADKSTFSYQVFGVDNVNLADLPPDERQELLQSRETAWNQRNITLETNVSQSPVSVELGRFIENFPNHTQIVYIDKNGALAAMSGTRAEHYNYNTEAWWQDIWNDGSIRIYLDNLQFSPGHQDATINIFIPVYVFNEDQPRGIMRSKYRLQGLGIFDQLPVDNQDKEFALDDEIKEIINRFYPGIFDESPSDNQQGEFALVDQTGVIVYGPYPVKVGESIPQNIKQAIASGLSPKKVPINDDIIYSYAPFTSADEDKFYLNDLGLALVGQQAASIALATFNTISVAVLALGAVVLIFAIGVSVYVARQISYPIAELTSTVSEMSGGVQSRRAKVSGPSEMRTLATNFNQMADQLEDTLAGLEEQVKQRTHRLKIVSILSDHLSGILYLSELLVETVNQVKDSFDYYHVHIYLLDDRGENLVMAEGTGEAGVEMKQQGYYIPLTAPVSLVSQAARSGQVIWANNVRQDENWLPNPLLPDTQAEVAVPIILDDTVVGVLDVQENEMATLDVGDDELLRSVANHVAVAIRNARLFAEVEEALVEARSVQEQYITQAWDRNKMIRQNVGQVRFSLGESTTLDERIVNEAREQALIQSEPTVIVFNNKQQKEHEATDQEGAEKLRTTATQNPTALVAPIKLRDVSIGNLQLHSLDPNREWSESELTIINAVIDQVAQAAENMRLLNETQEQASRERLIGQISNRLRSAPNIETLMKIGVEEVSRVIDPARTFVHFGIASELVEQGTSATEKRQIVDTTDPLNSIEYVKNGQGDTQDG